MPTFDFQCGACQTVFEKTLPFGSKSRPACPDCGSKKVEKMLSMPGIAFKGSGFYKTDSTKKEKSSTPLPNPLPTGEGVKEKPAESKKPDTSKKS